MIGSLDVLIVDDRPETLRFLVDFLAERCRRADLVASAKEAMSAINRRKAAGETYHLIICDFVMPGTDGLAFLRELRQRDEKIPFAFMTGYRSLNPTLESEAKRLGALTIFDKPLDLNAVERLLEQGTSGFRRGQAQASGEEPFFGTSRIMRRGAEPSTAPPASPSSALEQRGRPSSEAPSAPPEPLAMPPSGSWQKPQAALEPRVPESLRLQPAAPEVPPAQGYQRRPSAIIPVGSTTTTRVRRSVDPNLVAGTGRVSSAPAPQPTTSFRLRRGVEGTGAIRRPVHTESGRMFTCTICTRQFLVAIKPASYSTICLHCGQLQRIDPQQ